MPKSPKRILTFDGEYRFLSNFASSTVVLDHVEYVTVEHAYQAAKTLDSVKREEFRRCRTPGDAKRLGRKVPLREDWEDVKVDIMRQLVRQKFAYSPLRDNLLATGEALLVEGNTWGDTFWGKVGGQGENWLGRILMEVRQELRGPQRQ